MRSSLLRWGLAFALLSLWSCEFYYPDLRVRQAPEPVPYSQFRQASTQLIDINTRPHKGNIEVYFTGESRPTRTYLQLRYLSATKSGHDDVNSLVIDLKEQARAAGANGIIVTETRKWMSQVLVGETYQDLPKTDMNALAFVYPDSLQFAPKLLKAWNLYVPDTSGQSWVLSGVQPFSFDGLPLEPTMESKWLRWWFEHSDAYLVKSSQNLLRYRKDERGRPSVRTMSFRNTRVVLDYVGDTEQIKELKISDPEMGPLEIITYQYLPGSQQIASREIIPAASMLGAIPHLIEYPEYDQEGQVKAFLYLKKSQNQPNKQLFRLEIDYYTQEEWEAQVQAIIREQWGE